MVPERARRAYYVSPDHRDVGRRRVGDVPSRRASPREMVTALARIEGRAVGIIANNTRVMAGRDHRRRRRQGRPFPAAVRRLRPAGRVAGRLSRLHGRPGGRSRIAGAARFAHARRGRRAARAAGRGGAAPRLRPWRAGDGRRQSARAAAHRGVAGRPPRPDGPRGSRSPRAAQGARSRSPTTTSARSASGRRPRPRRRMPRRSTPLQLFEIDDVIDPADTRGLIAATLAAAASHEQPPRGQRFVDTW